MEWVETTGRSVEEAKEAALDRLGVGEDDAEFQLLVEPKSGLFGRIRTEARVRARVRPTKPRAKDDRRERKRRERPRSGGNQPRSGSNQKKASEPAAPRPSGAAARGGGRAVRNGAGAMEEDEISVAEQGELARSFVAELLDHFGAEGTVEVAELDEETVEVSVNGQDLGLLIGHKGNTLASLQELTRTVVQRHSAGHTARVLVDVAGYRQKRKEALERFAQQVAEKVRESGQEQHLEAMAPADRKVIHDAVNQIDGVGTRSEGLEPQRRVVIAPDGA